ncbi:recombinase zinc beta ribbon domain-containing protein [Planctomycetota bacterium]
MSRKQLGKLLRKRVYTGVFLWRGEEYVGSHQPLVSHELWSQVQAILDSRKEKPRRPGKRSFAFSGLIDCGHCGCALVGEIKKKRYIYYHCTGNRGRCGEPYVREEVLEEHFAEALDRLRFDDEVLGWVREALHESHKDEKKFHAEVIKRLQTQEGRYQNRIEAMYEDKLDGRITTEFYDRKVAEFRSEQQKTAELIEEHRNANRSYLDDGVRLIDLAQRAGELFRKQTAAEKRRLLEFVCSNSSWKGGELTVTWRQPFDLLADAKDRVDENEPVGGGSSGLRDRLAPRPFRAARQSSPAAVPHRTPDSHVLHAPGEEAAEARVRLTA